MIAAIQTHARDCPNLSLGVATFSTAQRDAILDELELARRTDPALDAYIGRVCHEPFFVKNLESVQGDERDVIFISVGYGRDASGYMSTNFGPINGVHGARRLNVLFSRAKCRCEVFSSITDEDIDIRGNPLSRGVTTLKTFLRYARTGLLELPRAAGREEDSPFEKSVLRAIEAMDYEADVQVGQSGFFVDIAIIDPDCPGRYLLGVECDGASYHSSRFARERDRLRQSVLESQGWHIYRIWSTDWFKHPEQTQDKLHKHIETLRANGNAGRGSSDTKANSSLAPASEPDTSHLKDNPPPASADSTFHTVNRSEPNDDEDTGLGGLAKPYKQAAGDARFGNDVISSIKGIVGRVLTCEAPMHRDELERRCRDFFGLARVAGSFEQHLRLALRVLERNASIVRNGEFFRLPQTVTVPRNRSAVTSLALRKPSMIAPDEYDAAIRILLQYCHGATKDDVAVGVARLFGFKTTSAQLRDYSMKSLARLVRNKEVNSNADGIFRLGA